MKSHYWGSFESQGGSATPRDPPISRMYIIHSDATGLGKSGGRARVLKSRGQVWVGFLLIKEVRYGFCIVGFQVLVRFIICAKKCLLLEKKYISLCNGNFFW